MKKLLDDKTPVMVEWYTYKWIPRRLHAIIVNYGEAHDWLEQGLNIQVTVVDAKLWRDMMGDQKR